MADCELLEHCGFFRKHGASHHAACRLLLRVYCQGGRQEECRRKALLRQMGHPPEDDVLPTGELFSELVG